MKPFDSVWVEVNNGIATVSLHRPEAGNSFDGEFFKEVAAAIELCDANEDVQVILLTGSGGPFRGKAVEELEHITPEQAVKVAALVDDYMDHQQAYLESKGLVDWE